MKTTANLPYYVIFLLDDNMLNTKDVISSLMLFSFDYEYACRIVECSYLFGREIIHMSDDREEIMLMEKVLNEHNVRVIVEKYDK